MPQPVDVVVDRRVLLDVEIGLRDVRLGLVVVVVGDEVLDRVVREELPELVAELRGERLVVRDHERRPLERLHRPGHRGRLAGAGRPEQRVETLACGQPFRDRRDRRRLVAGRPVGTRDAKVRHRLMVTPRVSAEIELVRVRARVDVLQLEHLVDVLPRLRERRCRGPPRATRRRSSALRCRRRVRAGRPRTCGSADGGRTSRSAR